MAERNNKGDDADTKRDITTRGETNPQDDIAQLRQSLDEVRRSVASVTTRLGEGAVVARQMASGIVEDVADRANEGVGALRSRIEDQPFAAMAIAFFAGVAIAGLVMGTILAAGSGSGRSQHQSKRRPRRAKMNLSGSGGLI